MNKPGRSERSERVRRALAEAKARGIVLGNPNLRDFRQRALVATQARADAFSREMRPIFAALETEGIVTRYGLARTLNKRKIPGPRGGLWNGTRVEALLKRIARLRGS